MDEVIQEFLIETGEGLDRMEQELVDLEADPHNLEAIESIFRTLHTIKGVSGFLAFAKLEALAHAGEDLLGALRERRLVHERATGDALLRVVDVLRATMATVERDGTDGEDEHRELIALLGALSEAGVSAPGAQPDAAAAAEPVARSGATELTVRVKVELLDKLVNVVGELVLARNQMLELTASRKDPALFATTQRLDLITGELQDGVMRTRLQPIQQIWSRFPRVCRDVAGQCGKRVRLEMRGSETELDRTILEAIRDPLTHLVRNAIDHGIETPEERAHAGKPAEGLIALSAYHEGGQVNIEISDDGQGIDLEAVRRRAAEHGHRVDEQGTTQDLQQLVFLPGFSTADEVSNISGRGVGMDVVRTNIEKLGGSIDLQSTRGQGTTLKLRIPLTLATIRTLTVVSAGRCFAIPQLCLRETLRLGAADGPRIERIRGVPVFRLRGELLPLVYLREALGQEPALEEGHGRVSILVLDAGDRQFGLVVDALRNTEEIVVKPLGQLLRDLRSYSGATIMGDGELALILDVPHLAQQARVIGDEPLDTSEAAASDQSHDIADALVVFRAGETARMAIPLSLITRLERIPVSAIERTGTHEIVQFRGELVPLVRIADLLGLKPDPDHELATTCDVILYTQEDDCFGLVVAEILDILAERLDVKPRDDVEGLFGTTVLGGLVTDLVDPEAVIRRASLPFQDGCGKPSHV